MPNIQTQRVERLVKKALQDHAENRAQDEQDDLENNNDDVIIDLDLPDITPKQVAKPKKDWYDNISNSQDENEDDSESESDEGFNYLDPELSDNDAQTVYSDSGVDADDDEEDESDKPRHFTKKEPGKWMNVYHVKRTLASELDALVTTMAIFESRKDANTAAQEYVKSLHGVSQVFLLWTPGDMCSLQVSFQRDIPDETIYVTKEVHAIELLKDIIKENKEKQKKAKAITPTTTMYNVVRTIEEWPEGTIECVGPSTRYVQRVVLNTTDINRANQKAHDVFVMAIQPSHTIVGANERYIQEILPACKAVLEEADADNALGREKRILELDDDEFRLTPWRRNLVVIEEGEVEKAPIN